MFTFAQQRSPDLCSVCSEYKPRRWKDCSSEGFHSDKMHWFPSL